MLTLDTSAAGKINQSVRANTFSLVITCLGLSISACSSGTTISNSNGTTILGTLPNGSVVYSNASSYTAVSGGPSITGTIGIFGGSPGYSYTFTFGTASEASMLMNSFNMASQPPSILTTGSVSLPTITLSPSPCILVSDSSTTSCTMIINPESAESGTYDFISTATGNTDSTTTDLNAIPVIITGSGGGSSSSITVSLTTPESAVLAHAGVGTPIVITFTGAIESTTVESGITFNVTSGGTQIPGTLVIESDNESATFTPTNVLSMNESVTVSTTTGILDESGNALSAYSTTFSTQPESYEIFVASNDGNGWTGNLYESAIMVGADPTVESNGILGADYLCQHDSQCQVGWKCQAMLVESTGTIRQAAPTPVNWVLQAYTAYKNESGSTVGITGITGSSPTNNFVFGFNFESAFSAVLTIPGQAWTGLNSDWTTGTSFTCAAWSSLSDSDSGIHGNVNVTSRFSIHTGSSACNTAKALYCVQKSN